MSPEMWQIVPAISKPLAALAFLIAVIGAFLWRREALKYKPLEGVTDPAVRLKMLRDLIGRYTPDNDNLRVEDKVKILDTQLRQGMLKWKWMVVAGVICFLALVLAILLVAKAAPQPEQSHQGGSVPVLPEKVAVTPEKGKLEIVDIALSSDEYLTNLEIKLRNSSHETYYIKRANLILERGWVLQPGGLHNVSKFDISEKYQCIVPDLEAPIDLNVPLSQALLPNEVDRFVLAIKPDSTKSIGRSRNNIWLCRCVLVSNSDNHELVLPAFFVDFLCKDDSFDFLYHTFQERYEEICERDSDFLPRRRPREAKVMTISEAIAKGYVRFLPTENSEEVKQANKMVAAELASIPALQSNRLIAARRQLIPNLK